MLIVEAGCRIRERLPEPSLKTEGDNYEDQNNMALAYYFNTNI